MARDSSTASFIVRTSPRVTSGTAEVSTGREATTLPWASNSFSSVRSRPKPSKPSVTNPGGLMMPEVAAAADPLRTSARSLPAAW